MILAFEEIKRYFHLLVFGAAFLEAAIADIAVRCFSGGLMSFLKSKKSPFFPAKKISTLGLSSGCLLIRYVLDEKEYVPTAGTFLEDHMRTNTIIAPKSEKDITMIRKGYHKK